MSFEITSGVISSAQKVVVYGPEGIGKSTFASQFPDPLFIDTEGSTKKLNVKRFPKPTSWEMLCNEIREAMSKKLCKTLVIDTIDWAEQLCLNSICDRYQKKGIEDFGYGNGYVYEKEEFGRFLNLLQDIVDSGINVVLTAHAQMRKFEQPDELGAYDRWELKLGKKTSSQISPLVKEWADTVLFANYKTYSIAVDDKGKKFKAQGGERVMYTSHHPCWDAKNRDRLPPEMPFKYAGISHLFGDTATHSEPIKPEPVIPDKKEIAPVQQETQEIAAENASVEEFVSDISGFHDIEKFQNSESSSSPPVNIPEKIPKELRDMMIADGIGEDEIRLVVSNKGYFPYDMPVENYPPDFITGWLLTVWQNVVSSVRENRKPPF